MKERKDDMNVLPAPRSEKASRESHGPETKEGKPPGMGTHAAFSLRKSDADMSEERFCF